MPGSRANTQMVGDAEKARRWLNEAHAVIVDLDGTLIRSGHALDGAAALLARFAGRFDVVSNNSTDTAAALARKLGQLGLKVPRDRLVLAGEETVHYLATRHPAARVMLLASPAIRRLAARAGITLVAEKAQLVVLARDTRFDFAKLEAAANELRRGAALIVANPDTSHPADGGRLAVETGSLMVAISACAGVAATRVVGKPEPDLFLAAMRRIGTAPSETLVIGDNPLTDKRGASRLGLKCVLVGQSPGAHAAGLAELLAEPMPARSR